MTAKNAAAREVLALQCAQVSEKLRFATTKLTTLAADVRCDTLMPSVVSDELTAAQDEVKHASNLLDAATKAFAFR